jgi:hypothetical protein
MQLPELYKRLVWCAAVKAKLPLSCLRSLVDHVHRWEGRTKNAVKAHAALIRVPDSSINRGRSSECWGRLLQKETSEPGASSGMEG